MQGVVVNKREADCMKCTEEQASLFLKAEPRDVSLPRELDAEDVKRAYLCLPLFSKPQH